MRRGDDRDTVFVDNNTHAITDAIVMPEMASQDNRATALNAVMAHEFGHQLGLVDLYRTDNFFTQLGDFALMDNNGFGTGVDLGFEFVFSRQIQALGKTGDLVLAISTSGKSKNVIEAVNEAKRLGIKTIGLSGKQGNALSKIVDISINVPSNKTARIQETHILICHILCELIETSL